MKRRRPRRCRRRYYRLGLATADWLIIAGYVALMLATGIVFSRRASRSIGEFFLTGRSLPWWIAGTSMVATTFAADTPLVVTSYVRTGGIGGRYCGCEGAA